MSGCFLAAALPQWGIFWSYLEHNYNNTLPVSVNSKSTAFIVLLTTQGALKSQSNSLLNFKIDKEDFCKAENSTTTNRKYPSLSAQP